MRSHLCVLATLLFAVPGGAQQPPPKPAFTFEEVMIRCVTACICKP